MFTNRYRKHIDQTVTQQNDLFHLINSAAVSHVDALVKEIKTKRSTACRCQNAFLIIIGIKQSIFLEGFSRFQKNILCSTFTQVVREATFSKGYKINLVQGTVETTISYMAQAFRSSDREDRDGKTCFLLQEQWRGYKNTDGNTKKQKPRAASALRKMNELFTTPWEVAVIHLLMLKFNILQKLSGEDFQNKGTN